MGALGHFITCKTVCIEAASWGDEERKREESEEERRGEVVSVQGKSRKDKEGASQQTDDVGLGGRQQLISASSCSAASGYGLQVLLGSWLCGLGC